MNKRVLINYYAKLLQKGYDESKIPEDMLEDVKATYKELPPRPFDPEIETPAEDALEKISEDHKKEEPSEVVEEPVETTTDDIEEDVSDTEEVETEVETEEVVQETTEVIEEEVNE